MRHRLGSLGCSQPVPIRDRSGLESILCKGDLLYLDHINYQVAVLSNFLIANNRDKGKGTFPLLFPGG